MKNPRLFIVVLILAFVNCATVVAAQTESTNPVFFKDIKVGYTGPEVYLLQKILNLDADTQVATIGEGSPGNEGYTFGAKTKKAVIAFQNKYADDILVPGKISQGTGYVGASTRVVLQKLLENNINNFAVEKENPSKQNNQNTAAVLNSLTSTNIFAPTIASVCTSSTIDTHIYWLESGRGVYGYFVDVDDDNNFDNGYWSVYIPTGTTQTRVPTNFAHLTAQGVWDTNSVPLVMQSQKTYYTRIFYNASNEHSPTSIFTTPSNCGTTPMPTLGTTITATQPITGQCYSSPMSSNVGQTMNWLLTTVSGGNGSYIYSWSGDEGLSGTGSSASKAYTTAGTKNASVVISSGGQSITASCTTLINQPQTTTQTSVQTPTQTTTNTTPTTTTLPRIIAPTIASTCSASGITANIYWQESQRGSYGYYVDIDNDNNFDNGYWVNPNVAYQTQQTAPTGYVHNTAPGVRDTNNIPLVFQPLTTYYVRVFYNAAGEHSPISIFTTPNCSQSTTISTPIQPVQTPVVTTQQTPTQTTTNTTPTQTSYVTPTGNGYPELGVNIEAVTDYGTSMMFADAMKSARSFSKDLDAPWSYTTTVPVDSNGWPTTDFSVLVFTDLQNAQGTYKISFTGKAKVDPVSPQTSVNVQYDSSSNTSSGDILVQGSQLALKFTNTTNGVKNIKIIRPGDSITDTFDAAFLQRIKSAQVLRLMDYMGTNGSPVRYWSDRARKTDATQTTTMKLIDPVTGTYPLAVDGTPIANCQWSENPVGSGKWSINTSTCVPYQNPKGGSIEYMIDLANLTGKDLWINVPSEATDTYVKNLATTLKQTLRADLHVYIEYSNEVWNGSFIQQSLNRAAAQKEVLAGDTTLTDNGKMNSDDYYVSFRRVAKRIVQISNIFKSVFGADAINTRVRPVLASQSANLDIDHTQLDYIAKYYGAPSKFIYGLAGAPYYNPGSLNDSQYATTDQLIDAMTQSINGYPSDFLQFDTLAKSFGLKAISYEGGTDTSGGADNANKIATANDPRMEDMTYKYLSNWFGCGGDLFMYYAMSGSNTKYGTWGLTDDIKSVKPKLKGFEKVSQTPVKSFICNIQDVGSASRSTPTVATTNSGNGLSGEYFSSTDLTSKTYSEIVPKIAFDWKNAMPYHGLPNSFGARWSGNITAPVSGTYNLFAQIGPSAGVKITIDGTSVVSDWPTPDSTKSGAVKEDTGSIYLTAGSVHTIKVEFYHQLSYFGNYPTMKLMWAAPGIPKSIVPASQLSH